MFRMHLDEAQGLARRLCEYLGPYCERIEVAGSVRREMPMVKDLELVARPKMEPIRDMFDVVTGERSLLDDGELLRRLGTIKKGGPRYVQIEMMAAGRQVTRFNLDLFIVLPPAQFGWLWMIRTGPADFSNWLVTRRDKRGPLPSYCEVHDAAVWVGDEVVPMETEEEVFEFIGLDFVAPGKRRALWGELH